MDQPGERADKVPGGDGTVSETDLADRHGSPAGTGQGIAAWSRAALFESNDAEFENIRVFPVPRYTKYLMFYRVHDDEIEIVRVLHSAMDIAPILEG